MKHLKLPAPALGPADEPVVRHQQTGRAGLSASGARSYRRWLRSCMQAAGVRVEELDDDQR